MTTTQSKMPLLVVDVVDVHDDDDDDDVCVSLSEHTHARHRPHSSPNHTLQRSAEHTGKAATSLGI